MFIETRGNDGIKPKEVNFSEAILYPNASFGGLYVPKSIPKFNEDFLKKAKNLTYKEVALEVLKLFKIDIKESVLKEALNLYDGFDNPNSPTPLVKIGKNCLVNELYHGPTRAFKDMALQPFGNILSHLAKHRSENYLILAATSGDTGPATLESFSNKPNIKVVCLYPDGGTSDVQRLQMTTASGKNLKVFGIHGNFDDAQQALKELLNKDEFHKKLKEMNINLSAANSVNFGRIIFQTIYHIYAYAQALKMGEISSGEKVYFTIPSGNFGNALGAYYAKKMGLPIEKILIASNINNILTQLFTTGIYDLRDRELLKTTSPAMDILISSNVERLLYDLFGSKRTKELMESLKKERFYTLNKEELSALQESFDAVYSDDDFGKEIMSEYALKGYILDPHTATCFKVKELNLKPLKNIFCATAEWTKFAPTLFSALQKSKTSHSDKVALEGVSNALKIPIPSQIKNLFSKEIIHDSVIDKKEIESEILKFLKDER
ncbi:MAG: threonine synthase [Sulfurospirillaceae bacterium]|nr:threonine synthase [Sulfurospirillaceae bacterium]MCK9545998.1 threonine synthase [Sulfurospirillaceae bacterium]